MNSYKIFWSILAYFAVFHFIRQQYGIVKLYSKRESDFQKKVGSISVYNATIYPMLFWFGTDDRVFNWFLSGEFYQLRFSNNILLYLKVAYILLILLYISIEIYQLVKNRVFNVPKNLLMISTYLTWYFGIVYFNNDLIFTLLNIVSHGVPYIALIYFNQREESHLSILPKMSTKIGLLVFLVIILSLAMVEEYLWEILVWEEKIWVYRFVNPFKKYDWILVPLLSVPQITHYILDGRIWRRTKAV